MGDKTGINQSNGGSAIGGGICHVCNKPTYWAGSTSPNPIYVCQCHNGVSNIGVPPRDFLDKLEAKGYELEAAKAKIKELQALIQAGDYGQRKTVETTRVESRSKDGLRVVVTEVTSFAPRAEFAIESPRAPGDFGYPGPIRTVELPPLWSPSMDTEKKVDG